MPECADCGDPAHGATFLSFVDGLGFGRHSWVARFSCLDCRAGEPFAMLCANLNQWRLYSRTAPGVYGLRKLSESEQNLRVLRERERHEHRAR